MPLFYSAGGSSSYLMMQGCAVVMVYIYKHLHPSECKITTQSALQHPLSKHQIQGALSFLTLLTYSQSCIPTLNWQLTCLECIFTESKGSGFGRAASHRISLCLAYISDVIWTWKSSVRTGSRWSKYYHTLDSTYPHH